MMIRTAGSTRTRTLVVAAAAALAPFVMTTPAGAHGGHGSCAAETQIAVVPFAQSGTAGELARVLARDGALPGLVEDTHAALCEPRP